MGMAQVGQVAHSLQHGFIPAIRPVPGKGPAAVRVVPSRQPDLVAVVNGRGPRQGHLQQRGQRQALQTLTGGVAETLDIMAGQQVVADVGHLRRVYA